MSRYLCKYVGTYRVLAEYDKAINDWPRDESGEIPSEYDDFYIPLKRNAGKIMHYDRDILILYLIGKRRYAALLKEMNAKDLVSSHLALKILETDEETLIYFKDDKLSAFAPYLEIVTQGKNIQPFSCKNLPKTHYELPKETQKEYSEIIAQIPQNQRVQLGILVKKFLAKDKGFRISGLNAKNYIHKIGRWQEFINFLKKNLTN